jgi:hypothetical protein
MRSMGEVPAKPGRGAACEISVPGAPSGASRHLPGLRQGRTMRDHRGKLYFT